LFWPRESHELLVEHACDPASARFDGRRSLSVEAIPRGLLLIVRRFVTRHAGDEPERQAVTVLVQRDRSDERAHADDLT
jgi:hypothetical protein